MIEEAKQCKKGTTGTRDGQTVIGLYFPVYSCKLLRVYNCNAKWQETRCCIQIMLYARWQVSAFERAVIIIDTAFWCSQSLTFSPQNILHASGFSRIEQRLFPPQHHIPVNTEVKCVFSWRFQRNVPANVSCAQDFPLYASPKSPVLLFTPWRDVDFL